MLFFCRNVLTNTQTRTAAEAESRAKGKEVAHNVVGCFGAIGKGEFIHNLPIDTRHKLHSNVTPFIPADKSAEAQHAERVPLSAQKSDCLKTVARASPCQTIELLLRTI